MTCVAVIESPFQLLSLQEAVSAETVGRPDRVLVRAGSVGPEMLDAIAPDLAARCEVRPLWIRSVLGAVLSEDTVILGDVFGKLVSVAVTVRRPRRVIALDDGSLTLHLVDLISRGARTYTRATSRRWHDRLLGRLTRRMVLSDRTSIVSGLPLDGFSLPASVVERIDPHTFEWTRDRAEAGPLRQAAHVVVGSALVADRLVDAGWYRMWLRSSCQGDEVVFVPHRRERSEEIAIARAAGAAVVEDELPIELRLADRRWEGSVSVLTGTTALTLDLLIDDATRVRFKSIDTAAWTASAAEPFRRVYDLIDAIVGCRPA